MQKRRIIYDIDLDVDKKGIISAIGEIAGTQVDTICWNVEAVNLCLFRYYTRVGEPAASTRALLARGTDPLEIAIREGHKKGMEVFANLRLNDTHCWSSPGIRSKFWKENYSKYRVKG